MNELKNKTELERRIFEEEVKINFINHQIIDAVEYVDMYKKQAEWMEEDDKWYEKVNFEPSTGFWKDSAHYVETKVKYELQIEEVNELHEKLDSHKKRLNDLVNMKKLFDDIDGLRESA